MRRSLLLLSVALAACGGLPAVAPDDPGVGRCWASIGCAGTLLVPDSVPRALCAGYGGLSWRQVHPLPLAHCEHPSPARTEPSAPQKSSS